VADIGDASGVTQQPRSPKVRSFPSFDLKVGGFA